MDWDEMFRAHVQVPKPFDSSRWLKIFACWLVVFQFRWSRVSEELSLSSLVNLIIRYMILLQKWPTSYVHSISHLIHQQKLKRTMGFWWLSHIFPTKRCEDLYVTDEVYRLVAKGKAFREDRRWWSRFKEISWRYLPLEWRFPKMVLPPEKNPPISSYFAINIWENMGHINGRFHKWWYPKWMVKKV